jgi:ribosomal protein S18 acetylase RimI-like enzyme
MIVRTAKNTDAPQLLPLLEQMGYQMSVDEMTDRVLAFTNSNHKLIVVEQSDKLIAMIAFACYEQFLWPSRCCHIDTLVVDIKSRGQGLGKKLITLAEEFAREHGANKMELISANHRKESGAHAFYQSLGYKTHLEFDYTCLQKKI